MSAPVRIEARAWGDIRFATLARLLGLADSDHALIKVARLWSWQTEHYTADQPTYVVDADTIESVLGAGGPAALVRAKLATEVPGGYRLHGTEGQIEWCQDLSSTRQQAGRARAAGARRDARGRLLPRENGEADHESPARSPADLQQTSSSSPAKSSAPSPSPSPSPEEDLGRSAPALPPLPTEPPGPEALTLQPSAPRQKREPKAVKRPLPAGWTPRPQERERARSAGIDPDAEAERFRDHHTARATTFADWDAGFRTWLSKAVQFSSAARAGPPPREPEQPRKIPTLVR